MSQTSFDGKWRLPPPKLKFYKFLQVFPSFGGQVIEPFIASYFPISNQQVPFGHVPNMEMEDTKITQLQEVMGCWMFHYKTLIELLEGKDYQSLEPCWSSRAVRTGEAVIIN